MLTVDHFRSAIQRLVTRLAPLGFSRSSKNASHDLGKRGERIAERFLRRKGYRIILRNERISGGEVDLIMESPAAHTGEGSGFSPAIVFIEVKTRSADEYRGEWAIGSAKRRRMVVLAQRIARRNGWQGRKLRIDVIVVVAHPDQQTPIIRHHPNAVSL